MNTLVVDVECCRKMAFTLGPITIDELCSDLSQIYPYCVIRIPQCKDLRAVSTMGFPALFVSVLCVSRRF